MSKFFEVRRYYYYRVDRSQDFVLLNDQLEIRQVTLENYQDVRDFNPALVPVFQRFLENGGKGIYGYMDKHIVGYAWSILNKENKSKRVRKFFPLPGNSACVHYCRVADDFQGQKIYQTMLAFLYRDLYREVKNIYLDTEVTNFAAQRSIEKVHGELLGHLTRLMCFGKTIATFKCLKR